MNLLFNSFEGSTEEKWVITEGRGSVVTCRETSFGGGGACENLVGLSMYDRRWERWECSEMTKVGQVINHCYKCYKPFALWF